MKQGKPTRSEKRKYVRLQPKEAISVHFKIVTKSEGEKVPIHHRAKTKNVSGGGMFLEIPLLEPKLLEGVLRGTHNLFLEINIPTSSYLVKALAKVVWIEGKTSKQYGVGVSFLSINEEDRDKLMEYIIEGCLQE
ncbi:MAG: PilZ domain-containing protein [Nitrospirae bacterium]|nr:PilZ domain-containing protein [Nitrospirota bacterium]